MDERLRRAREGLGEALQSVGALSRSASGQVRRFRLHRGQRRENPITTSDISEPMNGIHYFDTGLPNAEITTTITSDGPAGNPDFYTSTSRDILAVTTLTQTETRIPIPPGAMRRPSVTMRANRADRRRARTSSILCGIPLEDHMLDAPSHSEDGNNQPGPSNAGNEEEIQQSPTSPPLSDSGDSDVYGVSESGITPLTQRALATVGESATIVTMSPAGPAITVSATKPAGAGPSRFSESTEESSDEEAATDAASAEPVTQAACNGDETFGPAAAEATGKASGDASDASSAGDSASVYDSSTHSDSDTASEITVAHANNAVGTFTNPYAHLPDPAFTDTGLPQTFSDEDMQATALAIVAAFLGQHLPNYSLTANTQPAGTTDMPGTSTAIGAAENADGDAGFPPPPYTPVHANQLFPNNGAIWQIPGEERYPHSGAHLSLAVGWFSNQSVPIVCGSQIFHLPGNIISQFGYFRQLFAQPPGPDGYVLTDTDPQVFTILAHSMVSTTGFEGIEEGLNLVLLVLALEMALRMQIPSEARKITDSISRYIIRRIFHQNPYLPDFDGVLDHDYHVFRSEEIYRAWKILFDADLRLNMQNWLFDSDMARLYTIIVPHDLWPALTTNFQAYFNTIIDGLIQFRDAPEEEEFSLFWWQVVRGTDFLRNNWVDAYPHMRDVMAHQIQMAHDAENLPDNGQASGNAGGAPRNVSNGTIDTLVVAFPEEHVLGPVIDIVVNEATVEDIDRIVDMLEDDEDVMPGPPRGDSPVFHIYEDETAGPSGDN